MSDTEPTLGGELKGDGFLQGLRDAGGIQAVKHKQMRGVEKLKDEGTHYKRVAWKVVPEATEGKLLCAHMQNRTRMKLGTVLN